MGAGRCTARDVGRNSSSSSSSSSELSIIGCLVAERALVRRVGAGFCATDPCGLVCCFHSLRVVVGMAVSFFVLISKLAVLKMFERGCTLVLEGA